MPLNLHSTDWQKKLGGHISKNVAKFATNWLKISCAATFGPSLAGHNLVIFIRFWRSTTPKWSTHRDESNSSISFLSDFSFSSHFLPHLAQTQKYPQVVGTSPAYHHKLIALNRCARKILSPEIAKNWVGRSKWFSVMFVIFWINFDSICYQALF